MQHWCPNDTDDNKFQNNFFYNKGKGLLEGLHK